VQVITPLIGPLTQLALSLVKILMALMPLLPPMLQLQMLGISLAVKVLVPLAKVIAVVATVLAVLASMLAVVIGWVAKIIAWCIMWMANFRNVQNAGNELRAVLLRAFGDILAAAGRNFMELVSFFRSLPGRILTAVGDLGSLLFNAGKSIIQGLINGMKAMIPGPLRSALSWAASEVRQYWPFSPAKKGPLSGSGSMDIAGRNITRMLASGIRSGAPDVTGAMNHVAGLVNPRGGYGGPGGYGAGGKLEVTLTMQGTMLKLMQATVRQAGGDPLMFQRKVAYR
jgi:phage-related protein